MDTTNYGTCSFCGAKMVKNPHTGKIFCSDKCWSKKEKSKGNQSNEGWLTEKVSSIDDKVDRLVMILESIYPEMIEEAERRKRVSEEHKL